MDWLLVESIPGGRIGLNTVGDPSNFMEGVSANPYTSSTDYVTGDLFDSLIRSCSRLNQLAPGQVGGLSRVHGRGCESGLKDGYLSSNQELVVMEDMEPSVEWYFIPRDQNGLGVSGDSGAWIFLENPNHHALGQVWGHDHFANRTFYTPLYAIFEHIKDVTGALDVQLPSESDYRSLGLHGDSVHQAPSGHGGGGGNTRETLPGRGLEGSVDVGNSARPDTHQSCREDSGYSSS